MLKKTGRIGIFLFALVLVTSIVLFTGCGGGGVSLKGSNIVKASWWQTYNVNTYEPRNEGEERELEYRRRVMAEQGFSFEIIELAGYDDIFPLVVSNIMAGNKAYSMYEVDLAMATTLFKQGLLFPVGNSRAVNMKNREMVAGVAQVYDSIVEEFLTFGGVQYGWQMGLPNDGWGTTMLFFNPAHLVAAGMHPEHLYNLQRDNNWTWDSFLEVCRRLTRDTTGDGIIDTYAVHIDDARAFLQGLVYGNGANFVTLDAQGRAHLATNSPAFLEAFAFFNQLINEGLVATTPTYDWGQNWTAFVDGRIAMTFDPEWRKGQMNENFEAGYVLPPRGPRQNTLRIDAQNSACVIPNIFSPAEVDVILKANDLFYAPVDTDWFQGHFWASRNLRDVTETVAMSRDGRYLTPRNWSVIPGFPFDDFINDFRNGLGGANPAQIVEQWTPRLQSAIDDFNR